MRQSLVDCPRTIVKHHPSYLDTASWNKLLLAVGDCHSVNQAMHATDVCLPGNAESEVWPRPSAGPPVTAEGPSRLVSGPSAPFHRTSGSSRRELRRGVL
jgi:hypothetical protein